MDRYIVVSNLDAIEAGYPGAEEMKERYERHSLGDVFCCLYETDGEKPIRLVGNDHMEPEDARLYRDLSWLVNELNSLAREIDHLSELGNSTK